MTLPVEKLEQKYRRTYLNLIAITAAYGLCVVVGIVILLSHPRTADWVSQAVQAEFVTANTPPSP
jgi:hypothetical protein